VQWDNVLTGVIGPAPWETVLHDPHAGVSIVQSCDVAFRHCVVYTPPHRQAVCLEPYSCVPGWIGQAYAPPEGEVALERVLNVLAPGSATRLQIIIRVA
jgi:aldose 1-epimerase